MDDNFADSPSVWALSDAAYRLHSSGLLYCSRLRTDGIVPAGKVANLVPKFKVSALNELLHAAKWTPIGGSEVVAYEIKNYLEWNSSAEQIEAQRKAAEQRKSRWKERNANA